MQYSKNSLMKEAEQVKNFFEKNKKMPNSSTLDNKVILSPYSVAYLLARMVNDNFKNNNYTLAAVVRYNTLPFTDTIVNSKVLRADYLVMTSNFLNYCHQTNRVPSFVTIPSSKVRVSFELFYYCLTKIAVYYNKNKVMPNYCIFDKNFIPAASPEPAKNCYTKYNSKSGCDAMGQNNNYYCGVSALQKVLYKFGINETQKQLARWAGTTTAGTSHNGIRTAIAKAGQKHNVKLTVKEANFTDYTLKQIRDIICSKDKDIIWHLLYRGKYGHYEKVLDIDLNSKNFKVINSLGNKCNYGCYCGYLENRSYNTQRQYCNGISQPSLIIVTKGG